MTKTNHRTIVIRLLFLIYFFSGACSLIDEVIWARLIKLIIGNTVYASSVVVSVFMAGLATGAIIMGRFCDRIKRSLRIYALIELFITFTVFLSPWALRIVSSFYVWFWQTYYPSRGFSILVQAILSGVVIFIPTVLMGSTLPLLARFISTTVEDSGRLIGRLYAVNTLGAALGCFMAGFVLIRAIGVNWTLRTSVIANLIVACGGYFLYRMSLDYSKQKRLVPEKQSEKIRMRAFSHAGLRPLAVAFFLSGLVCIGYELFWMRSIVFSVGSYTYVFSAVLTIYLIGNVVGTILGAHAVRHTSEPGKIYAVIFTALGLCGVLYVPWLHFCNFTLFSPEWTRLMRLYQFGGILRMLKPLLQCAVFFLIPSIIMGFGFPFMIQAWVNRARKIGMSTGFAYSLNTWGAVTGGILTGFIVIPALGVQAGIASFGLIVMWVAGWLWFYFSRERHQGWLLSGIFLITTVCMAVLVNLIPQDLFTRSVALCSIEPHYKVLAVKEGINTTVSVHQSPEGDLYLYTANCMVAGTAPFYRADQKMLGHLPVMLNAQADSVLTVGFGTGESSICLLKHNIHTVDAAEIAPEVVDMAIKFFAHLNKGESIRDDVNIIYMDARNYLTLTKKKYDVIVNDCSSIRGFAENSSLYTQDYFQRAMKRLTDNGMFMSWINNYSTEGFQVVNSLLGTMLEVFPYVTLWYTIPEPAEFFLIVGSLRPQYFSIQHMEKEFNNPLVAESLRKVNIHSVTDILSCYVADERDIKKFLKNYHVNTDDKPYIEFSTEPSFEGYAASREFYKTVRSHSLHQHLDWTGIPQLRKQEYLKRYADLLEISDYILNAQTSSTTYEKLEYALRGLKKMPANQTLLKIKYSYEQKVFLRAVQGIAENRLGGVASLADHFLELDPHSHYWWVLRSQVYFQQNNMKEAINAANQALQLAPNDPITRYNLWNVRSGKQDYRKILEMIK